MIRITECDECKHRIPSGMINCNHQGCICICHEHKQEVYKTHYMLYQ